jgi:hypothetical protein
LESGLGFAMTAGAFRGKSPETKVKPSGGAAIHRPEKCLSSAPLSTPRLAMLAAVARPGESVAGFTRPLKQPQRRPGFWPAFRFDRADTRRDECPAAADHLRDSCS